MEDEEKAVAFISDGAESVMLELGRIPDFLPLAEGLSHHLQLPIALKSERSGEGEGDFFYASP